MIDPRDNCSKETAVTLITVLEYASGHERLEAATAAH